MGGEEFGADQHRHQSADEEEKEGGEEVLDADFFVIGGEGEVSVPAAGGDGAISIGSVVGMGHSFGAWGAVGRGIPLVLSGAVGDIYLLVANIACVGRTRIWGFRPPDPPLKGERRLSNSPAYIGCL